MPKTLIFVSSKQEVQAAIKYLQHQKLKSATLVATEITSVLYLRRNNLPHQVLYQLQPWKNKYYSIRHLPLTTAQTFLNQPQVKKALTVKGVDYSPAFVEVLRYRIQIALRDFLSLTQVCQQTNCQQIIIGNSFPENVVEMASRELGIEINKLAVPTPVKPFTNKYQAAKKIIPEIKKMLPLFYRNPLTALKSLTPFHFRQHGFLGKGGALVFSNGMNLVSYHSVFRHLNKLIPVNIVTDHQSLKDSFYINRYKMKTTAIDLFKPKKSLINSAVYRQIESQIKSLVKNKKIGTFPTSSWIKSQTLQGVVRTSLLSLTSNWLPTFLSKYFAAQTIIKKIQPKLIMTTNDPGPSAMAFIIPAKKKKISTLLFAHGSPSEISHFYSDNQIIWGKLMKKYLVSQGISASKLITAGHPIYYNYKVFFQNHKKESKKKIELGIIASGYGHNETHQVEFFLKLFPQLGKLKSAISLSVRFHSAQSIDGLNDLAKMYHLKLKNSPELLEEFVAQSDVVITQKTTAALVPLIAGKPTIYLPAYHPTEYKGSLINQSGFPQPIKYSQVPLRIKQLIDNPQLSKRVVQRQQNFLPLYCGSIDRHIGSRTAEKIIKLIKSTDE